MSELEFQNWLPAQWLSPSQRLSRVGDQLGGVGQNTVIVLLLIIWSAIWKGMALWRAARTEQTGWFVALLIVNTLGLLEIVYLYLINPKKK